MVAYGTLKKTLRGMMERQLTAEQAKAEVAAIVDEELKSSMTLAVEDLYNTDTKISLNRVKEVAMKYKIEKVKPARAIYHSIEEDGWK